MSSTPVNIPVDTILSAIKRKGRATLTDIKRSIAEFNQAGGADKLRKYLADLVSNGSLIVHTDKSGNGQIIESYCLIDGNDVNACNVQNNIRNGSNRNVGNADNLKISGTFDIALEGWENVLALLFSLTNTNHSNDCADNSNESNTEISGIAAGEAAATTTADAADDEDTIAENDVAPSEELTPFQQAAAHHWGKKKPNVPVRQAALPTRPSSPPRPVRCPVDTEYERVRRLGLEDEQGGEAYSNSKVDDSPF